MNGAARRVSAGRVGRVHGRDGSFYVERPDHALEEGTEVEVSGAMRTVERRAGTAERPLVRLSGVEDRKAARALQGEPLLVPGAESPLDADEWLAGDLVGLRVEDLGVVERVGDGPSCSVLEVDDGTLIPFVSDAVLEVDTDAGVVRVDRDFLKGGDED